MTMALIGIILDLLEPAGATAYDLTDFRVAMCAQYVFWLLGIVPLLRYRRKAIAHLEREHPGAVETLKQGEPFVHPGFNDRGGVRRPRRHMPLGSPFTPPPPTVAQVSCTEGC